MGGGAVGGLIRGSSSWSSRGSRNRMSVRLVPVQKYHRRRMETEAKAKVVASV